MKQAEAIRLAVLTLKVTYSEDFFYWDEESKIIVPCGDTTDERVNFETFGYFDPESDNADVMFDMIKQVTGHTEEAEIEQIMFYIYLILEDFYKAKVTRIFEPREMYIVQSRYSHVDNLTPEYLKHSKDMRHMLFSLLSGGYYDEFVS